MIDPRRRPVVLVVLDGFGLNDDPARNALLAARMPTWDALQAEWPYSRLDAAGSAVGLPSGQMGNSEVGHLNLGAGFRVVQDLPRISSAIADGSFFANPALRAACQYVTEHRSRLHLLGLIGPGGIHAVDEHILAMVEFAAREGLRPDSVALHAFTDGRDTPPRSADHNLATLEAKIAGRATVATVSGRSFAMDRDQRWARVAVAWEAIVHGQGPHVPSAPDTVREAYARGEGDEIGRASCRERV